jgi:hypothetical protein
VIPCVDTRLVSYLSSVPVSFRLKQLLNLGFEAIGCLRQPQRLITVAANHGLTALGVGLPRSHSGHRVVVSRGSCWPVDGLSPCPFLVRQPKWAKGRADVCVKCLCVYASLRSVIIFLAWTLGTILFSDTLSGFAQEAPCMLAKHGSRRESTSRGRSLGRGAVPIHPPLERTFSPTATAHMARGPG